jgi:hypothetical protein
MQSASKVHVMTDTMDPSLRQRILAASADADRRDFDLCSGWLLIVFGAILPAILISLGWWLMP